MRKRPRSTTRAGASPSKELGGGPATNLRRPSIVNENEMKVKEEFDMSELCLSLCKVRALVSCLDDAITSAITDNPGEAGERALCLVDLLVEHMEAIVRMTEDQERGAA